MNSNFSINIHLIRNYTWARLQGKYIMVHGHVLSQLRNAATIIMYRVRQRCNQLKTVRYTLSILCYAAENASSPRKEKEEKKKIQQHNKERKIKQLTDL